MSSCLVWSSCKDSLSLWLSSTRDLTNVDRASSTDSGALESAESVDWNILQRAWRGLEKATNFNTKISINRLGLMDDRLTYLVLRKHFESSNSLKCFPICLDCVPKAVKIILWPMLESIDDWNWLNCCTQKVENLVQKYPVTHWFVYFIQVQMSIKVWKIYVTVI